MRSALLFLLLCSAAQAQVPHLTGTVTLSVGAGTISCDLTVTGLPQIRPYRLWLNAGFSVDMMDDARTPAKRYVPSRRYDEGESYEAFQYQILTRDSLLPLPPVLHLKYTGAFPVYRDSAQMYPWEDWMGNMSFNGTTFRASNQSAWYPILYDPERQVIHDRVTYELTVQCSDCSAVYLSGDAPKTGTRSTFRSEVPAHLLLFAGRFGFEQEGPLWFVNTPLSREQMRRIGTESKRIVRFYERLLDQPYGASLSFVSAKASAVHPGFSFVSYPTITFVGNQTGTWDIRSMFAEGSSELQENQIPFLAHELAHYYVGTVFRPSGSLYWAFNEGLTEYLASRYVRSELPDSAYRRLLGRYAARTEQIGDFKPLSEVRERGELAFDAYRYHYVPLLLTAIGLEAGDGVMDAWLRVLMQAGSPATDYAFLRSSLLAAGLPPERFGELERSLLAGPGARDQAILRVRAQYPPAGPR